MKSNSFRRIQGIVLLLTGLGFSSLLSGCVVMGGSSRGGFFIWPGSLGLLVIVVLFLLLRRR